MGRVDDYRLTMSLFNVDLYAAINEAGVSFKKLAKKSGIKHERVKQLLAKDPPPSYKEMARLAKCLGYRLEFRLAKKEK